MVRNANHELVKPPFKLRQMLLKTAKRAIKRLPLITLIISLLIAVLRLKISHQALRECMHIQTHKITL